MIDNLHTVKSLPITTLPLSPLVKDYLLSNQTVTDCFQSVQTPLEVLLPIRLEETKTYRSFISTVFTKNQDTIPLSVSQQHSLNLFNNNNAAVIVTGQQAAILGGPFYTWSKIAHTIVRAKKATELLNHPVVPVFWLEDNDHDALEAGVAHWFTDTFDVEDVYYTKKRETNNVISEMILDQNIENFLEEVLAQKKYPFTREQISLLKNIHRNGQSVTESFHAFVSASFKEFGLLIVRSSDIRKLGGYESILRKELEDPILSYNAVLQSSKRVESLGYELQVKPQIGQVFYHDGSKRRKVSVNTQGEYTFHSRTIAKKEFFDFFEAETINFSPSALLRLVTQDILLPSLEVVMGPGELSYAAQTKQLYQLHSITQPTYIFRNHSVAIFDSIVERVLTKENKPLEWLFLDSQIHLQELNAKLENEYGVAKEYDRIQKEMAQKLIDLKDTFLLQDPSMKGHFESNISKVKTILIKSEKKVNASVKRQNYLRLEKITYISKLLRPNSRQQERYICSAFYGMMYGIEEISRMLVDAFSENELRLIILPSVNPK